MLADQLGASEFEKMEQLGDQISVGAQDESAPSPGFDLCHGQSGIGPLGQTFVGNDLEAVACCQWSHRRHTSDRWARTDLDEVEPTPPRDRASLGSASIAQRSHRVIVGER